MLFETFMDSQATLAYIGPGGGISLLVPLIGLVVAIVGALATIAIWPLRLFWKRLKRNNTNQTETT